VKEAATSEGREASFDRSGKLEVGDDGRTKYAKNGAAMQSRIGSEERPFEGGRLPSDEGDVTAVTVRRRWFQSKVEMMKEVLTYL